MSSISKHIISEDISIKDVLEQLNKLAPINTLFVVGENNVLIGSVTDGDVRRALIKGANILDPISKILQPKTHVIKEGDLNLKKFIEFRENDYKLIPVINDKKEIIRIINFKETRSLLPFDAIVMAGGRGSRLAPLTDTIPKPLLKIGNKPIMEYNINNLIKYGVNNFWFSINYLGEQIKSYFGDGKSKNLNFNYIKENSPLGTIGSVSLIDTFKHDVVLVTNSDLLTTIDYELFYLDFIENDAAMSVVTIPYKITVPYGVVETKKNNVNTLVEKPTYTYYSNAGIYLIKKEFLTRIPKGIEYNATDFLMQLVNSNEKVITYPFSGYWLDIGNPEDFKKAEMDINRIQF